MIERRALSVLGVVQGVGFRPFVHRLALELHLFGVVHNDARGVHIEVEGEAGVLDAFRDRLLKDAPAKARIEKIEETKLEPKKEGGFAIEKTEDLPSESGARVPADIAPCAACLRELFDPHARRHRYPFISCAECGPRFTIITALPYDRARTTLDKFPMCAACRREYDDPRDRRHHAQSLSCPSCGPKLALYGRTHRDPLKGFAEAIARGEIGALKGWGGYHLVADARRAETVRLLRARKNRPDKPLAIMVRDEQTAAIAELELPLLASSARPILIGRRRRGSRASSVIDEIAPGLDELGIMLPTTPLQHLLFAELGDVPLVMTSGNVSEAPIIADDDEALSKLGKIADVFLGHTLPIAQRCDDSVLRGTRPIRRARGLAPLPIPLPLPCKVPTVALGNPTKAVFAMADGDRAILSHHLGDLDESSSYLSLLCALEHFESLFGFKAQRFVVDRNLDFATRRLVRERNLDPALEVQHHHAHFASCLAEHQRTGPAIGVLFDGTGGEFLVGELAEVKRAAHLRPVPLPGGEAESRQIGRMALAHLLDAGIDPKRSKHLFHMPELDAIARIIEQKVAAPMTSGMGRLFDAVAFLVLGLPKSTYDGHAASLLEALAARATPETRQGYYNFAGTDARPVIAAVIEDLEHGVDPVRIARRFHSAVVAMVKDVCVRLRAANEGVSTVVLSGGVFANRILDEEVTRALESERFEVLRHSVVPPNNGGIALGQLAIAAALDWHSTLIEGL